MSRAKRNLFAVGIATCLRVNRRNSDNQVVPDEHQLAESTLEFNRKDWFQNLNIVLDFSEQAIMMRVLRGSFS